MPPQVEGHRPTNLYIGARIDIPLTDKKTKRTVYIEAIVKDLRAVEMAHNRRDGPAQHGDLCSGQRQDPTLRIRVRLKTLDFFLCVVTHLLSVQHTRISFLRRLSNSTRAQPWSVL